MAIVTPSMTRDTDAKIARARWVGLIAAADVGVAVGLPDYLDRTVQVVGSFGAGGQITIEGSLDGGTTYATLTDQLGNPLVFSAAGIKYVTEVTPLIRPRQTAGSGANLDVHIHFGGKRQ
jgi:hypothetical protein